MPDHRDPRIVVYTLDAPGLSPYVIGHDLRNMFEALGYRAVCTGKLTDVHNSWIFSLRVGQIRALARLPRYNKIHACQTIHAQNIEEFDSAEWASLMAYYTGFRPGKCPYTLKSISRWQYGVIKKKLPGIFSPSRLRSAFGPTPTIKEGCYGILDEFTWSQESDRNVFMVPYNRVGTDQKNYPLHVKVTNQVSNTLAARGVTTQHRFYHAPGFGPDDDNMGLDFSAYTVEQQPDTREGFLKNIRIPGMAISTAKYESLGLYYIELLASGCVVVFLDRPWIRELFPGYKFLAKEEDLAAMTVNVWKNWDAARAYLKEEVLPVIEDNYRLRSVAKGILADFPGIEEARL